MRRCFVILLTALAFISASQTAANAQHPETPLWEAVDNSSDKTGVRLGNIETSHEPFEVFKTDNGVYIRANSPVKVEVFSILGQLIASRKLSPGTVRLNIRQRGVYIIKAGGITRRINI